MIIKKNWLPFNQSLELRPQAKISMAVIHATELPTLADARDVAENSDGRVAAHYYVDRDGQTEEWIPPHLVAHHALAYNSISIGIELVNLGRYPNHFSSISQMPTDPFPRSQIDALISLLELLRKVVATNLTEIRLHAELDTRCLPSTDEPDIIVRRRIDPGPMFPAREVQARFYR